MAVYELTFSPAREDLPSARFWRTSKDEYFISARTAVGFLTCGKTPAESLIYIDDGEVY